MSARKHTACFICGWLIALLLPLSGCQGAGTRRSSSAPSLRKAPAQAERGAAKQNPPALQPLPAARARVPAGFRIEVVTSGLDGVRMMAFSPDGRLFATQPQAGRVMVVPIGGSAPSVWATGLNRPHGIAFHGGYLYVANTDAVVRWPYRSGSPKAPGAPARIAKLPAGGMHWSRTVGFGPDGKMYVSAGSDCNVCIESDPRRAAIQQFNADGSGAKLYATGLRNAVGFTWDRQGRMWATENGTDNLGDNFPPDELNLIRAGGFYGWPYAHGDREPYSRFARQNPRKAAQSLPPAFKFPAHSAPLGLSFYYGAQFPAQYQGDAFVALHGSWNRSTPVGYTVVRVHFQQGQPVSASDFVTGFGMGDSAWARPVGVVVDPQGSLLISADKGGYIFRVRAGG